MKTNRAYIWKIQGAAGNQESSLKGLVHTLTRSKIQRRDSSLKNAWVIREGDTLTNFRASDKDLSLVSLKDKDSLETKVPAGTIFPLFLLLFSPTT